jgi:hypothetical protein
MSAFHPFLPFASLQAHRVGALAELENTDDGERGDGAGV